MWQKYFFFRENERKVMKCLDLNKKNNIFVVVV